MCGISFVISCVIGLSHSNMSPSQRVIVLYLVLTQSFPFTESLTSWLSLMEANASEISSEEACTTYKNTNGQQKRLCRSSPSALLLVSVGLQMSLTECQFQFEGERWNCLADSFKAFAEKGTKESAFIYSITSAAITHTITRACSSSNMTTCTCAKVGKRRRRREEANMEPWPYDWQWGGCSDNIKYGKRFSEKFVDALDTLNDNNSMIQLQLHNNKVGRKLVAQSMITKCKCHGVSGACAVRTCWRALVPFDKVGTKLKALYDNSAIRVARESRGRRLRPADKTVKKRSVKRTSLVYNERSPDFCVKHPQLGIQGVKDRECNKSSPGVDGCSSLCCGRGYNTRIVEEEERCECKFHWCCHVTCKTCTYTKQVYTCK